MLMREYPYRRVTSNNRKYTEREATSVFLRDGFVDRYSGAKLVFPAVLRTLSILYPDAFPFHKNWKMSECHIAYWELFPTIDHIVPVARGGLDAETKWITTSMLRNSAKANWLLEELGWQLHPPGGLEQWDGLMEWFMKYADSNSTILSSSYLKKWYTAAKQVSGT